MEYRVKWEIDIEADNALHAARQAREIQLDRNSWATVFEMQDSAGRFETVVLEMESGKV
jgi:hypothetical protein